MNDYLQYLLGALVFIALRYAVKRVDERLHAIQREALDSTIQWSYFKGYTDGHHGRDFDLGSATALAEFRETFGTERREVRK